MLKYYDEETMKIIAFLKNLSDKGVTNAMINLADLYREGKRVGRNYSKAISLYKKAQNYGNGNAIFYLAHMFEHGLGTCRDINKAIEYYKLAIDFGNTDAMNDLAYLYSEGKYAPKNNFESSALFDKAIEEGNLSAIWNRALECQKKGDMRTAIALFNTAAQQGDVMAINKLAYFHEKGIYVKQNIEQAIKLYNITINKKSEVGMYKLALIHCNNFNDMQFAIELMTTAREKGYIPATIWLENYNSKNNQTMEIDNNQTMEIDNNQTMETDHDPIEDLLNKFRTSLKL